MATAMKYRTTSWEAPGSFAGADTDATVRSADWGQAPVGAYGTRAGVKYRLPDRNEGVNLNPDKGRDWDNTVLAAGNSRTGYSTGVQGQGGAGQPTATQRARQQSGASNVTAAQTSAATGGSGAGSGGASNSPWQPPAATTGAGAGYSKSSGLTPYEEWVNSQSPGGGRATNPMVEMYGLTDEMIQAARTANPALEGDALYGAARDTALDELYGFEAGTVARWRAENPDATDADIRTMSQELQRNNALEAERARSAALQEAQDNMPIAIGPDGQAITKRSVDAANPEYQEQRRRREFRQWAESAEGQKKIREFALQRAHEEAQRAGREWERKHSNPYVQKGLYLKGWSHLLKVKNAVMEKAREVFLRNHASWLQNEGPIQVDSNWLVDQLYKTWQP